MQIAAPDRGNYFGAEHSELLDSVERTTVSTTGKIAVDRTYEVANALTLALRLLSHHNRHQSPAPSSSYTTSASSFLVVMRLAWGIDR